jgi:hypothetical protein
MTILMTNSFIQLKCQLNGRYFVDSVPGPTVENTYYIGFEVNIHIILIYIA